MKPLSRAEQREVLRELMTSRSFHGQVGYWWQAENPFQFLATCFEIHKANASGELGARRGKKGKKGQRLWPPALACCCDISTARTSGILWLLLTA
jgi:hypothetical protein